ncbi:MAG: hypothetical protein HYV97_02520 [Bdellovibrio sp.]|nr:hypothetical protein [Bdellovibrio sp.]
MNKIVIVAGLMLYTCTAWSLSSLDSGKFSLSRTLNGKEFTISLNDYKRFADEYVNVTGDSDLSPCLGWSSFTKISRTHIDMCTRAEKLGYSIQVLSQFKASTLNDSRCLGKMKYSLQIMPGTRPALLPENVRLVQTEFCLNADGRTVSYDSYIEEGPHKGLLFPFIAVEFKKLIPDLIKSIQALVR